MFDINTLINNAIATAVDARITEMLQAHANITGALAKELAELGTYTRDLELRVKVLEKQIAEPSSKVEFTDGQHRAFVNHLNDQEWFWDKINGYVERRFSDEAYVTKEEFQDLFDEALGNADLDDPVREVLRNVSVSLYL